VRQYVETTQTDTAGSPLGLAPGGVKQTNIGSELVRALCGYLALRRHFFWQNNAGAGGFYRFGTPGSPDIMFVRDGKFIGI
jgi:hypothetical protein